MLAQRAAAQRGIASALRVPTRRAQVRFASATAGAESRVQMSFAKKAAVAAGVTVAVGAGAYFAVPRVYAGGALGVHPAKYPWDHDAWNKIYDHASLRRGFQVYKEVCSACHSLKYVAFRHLVGVTHTEEEVKAIAAEYEVEDGPDDTGEMFMRPGAPVDFYPKPYKNDQAARVANAGALPPDLSLMTIAREGGADYVFSLLTGYCDPAPGADTKEGLHYNPYFPGGWIAMARSLYDGLVEYEDGTPATTSQMAKDVVTFLCWSAQPDHDLRRELGFKSLVVMIPLCILAWYVKRFKFAALKSRKLVFSPPKK